MQEAGDPVTIVNPGGVIGPHDPYLGETNEIVVQVLLGKQPVFPRGRQQFVDVRISGWRRSASPAALMRTLSFAPRTALLAARAPTPASDTEFGLPSRAMAFSSGNASTSRL